MRVYRDIVENGQTTTIAVFDIMEATYSGQDMGRRAITATIKFTTPIDFKIGDYVVMQMQSLERDGNHGSILVPGEKFYIYTEPQCKKTARPMSTGDAFETTVVFYPRQYELSCIQMRDFIQEEANADKIIYTGFDNVTFYGGAHELLERCMACLAQQYHDNQGNGLWSYELAPDLNEEENNALERYAFSFSGNSVMDALMKLNDKDYINTTFYINDRTIYVGYKRPFLCAVNAQGNITDTPLSMMYGKTSHMPIDLNYGGLYDITKTVSEEVPITKLFAYGAARNLNRYYCADRIHSGRFVNKLMLPSFSDDGRTDYIISQEAAQKYGIREGSHTFEEIYPSLRYMTYADIRGIKYCIKIKTSGLDSDQFLDGIMDHDNSRSSYPVARVQCYKVVPCTGDKIGRNMLVEAAPPEDLAIFIHATGKTVKCVLYGGETNEEALEKQLDHDPKVPTRDGDSDYIYGSCFCVHDNGFDGEYDPEEREEWFDADTTAINDKGSNLHRIEYVDTFWLTDLYVFTDYMQKYFPRDGYSAWAWPRLNNESGYSDNLPVNEVVAVEKVVIPDTSDNLNAGRQQHWDIYLRDLGFAIDEQNDFGEMVFVYDTPVVSVLDGILAGREFTIDGGENLNDFQERVVCAYKEDGSLNSDFLYAGDSGDESVPANALLNGAIWRIRLNRNNNDGELSSIGLVIPNVDIQMSPGDHVVLLDIFMPDIYVRAAEQRLLREARNYLDKNDKGNVKYSINFDKVRFNQIQAYARQMREGVALRVVDEDLNISSDNVSRKILDHSDVPSVSDVPMYIMEDKPHIEEDKETTYTFYKQNDEHTPKFSDVAKIQSESANVYKVTIDVPKLEGIAKYKYDNGSGISLNSAGVTIWQPYKQPITLNNFKCTDVIDHYVIEFTCGTDTFGGILDTDGITVNVSIVELVSWMESVKTYVTENTILPAICRDYVHFKAGKYYEVIVDLQSYTYGTKNYYWRSSGTHGSGQNTENNDQIILTVNNYDIATRYKVLQYTKQFVQNLGNNLYRYKYSFYLPDSFNENNGYYVAFYYFTPDNSGVNPIDFATVRMVSVTEKDLDAEGNVVNYVDFLVSNVTIKLLDNTRPADVTGMSDEMRERIIPVAPEPIYDIQAQIQEQTKASTWGQVMNDLEKTKIETERNKQTYELLTQVARHNYQSLLNLRNNIFDPDGTCKDVFLQTMMLQVGADSMNYQLDYTQTLPDGTQKNFVIDQQGTNNYFRVIDADVLRHFVYTQGAGNGGTWRIPGNFSCELEPNQDGSWPVYYVCIRCKKDTANDLSEEAWICSTRQYAVNESANPGDSDYWYFNWAILTPDSNGDYTLTETRGNAYMYGDNIVAGKITTIAGNAFFDLTHGEFVLGAGQGTPTLSYQNGVLTIGGINNELGLGAWVDGIDKEAHKEIGGENLYTEEDPIVKTTAFTKMTNLVLERGKKYVISIDSGTFTDNVQTLHLYEYGQSEDIGTISSSFTDRKSFVTTGHGGRLTFGCYISGGSLSLLGIMVQKGEKPTSYQTSFKYLAEAFEHDATKQTTDITGGLLATSLIKLRNQSNQVTAGMSGLKDYGNTVTIEGEDYECEGVTVWGGGDYIDALKAAAGIGDIAVLLTKSGINSRIGCFRVVDKDTISVKTGGNEVFITNNNISNYVSGFSTQKFTLANKEKAGVNNQSAHNEDILLGSVSNVPAGAFKLYVPQFDMEFSTISTQSYFAGLNVYYIELVLTYTGGSYTYRLYTFSTPLELTGTDSEDITIDSGIFDLTNTELRNMNVYLRINCSGYHTGGISNNYSKVDSFAEKIEMREEKRVTVIGKDGMVVSADSSSLFYIYNSGENLDVRMSGLPKSTTEEGKLFDNGDGIVRIYHSDSN